MAALRLGVGGPVGSGKTALVAELCRRLGDEFEIAAVTNDIYTREDAEFLQRAAVLPEGRVLGVETGGCPHTAIRDDVSMNLVAVEELEKRFAPLDLVFVESGGDNLAASFSPELVDASIYVVDVAGGDKVPRKGGPGVTRSELLIINKTDLAPLVGADLSVMERDADALRGDAPTLLAAVLHGDGMDAVVEWVMRGRRAPELDPRQLQRQRGPSPRSSPRALGGRASTESCGSGWRVGANVRPSSNGTRRPLSARYGQTIPIAPVSRRFKSPTPPAASWAGISWRWKSPSDPRPPQPSSPRRRTRRTGERKPCNVPPSAWRRELFWSTCRTT